MNINRTEQINNIIEKRSPLAKKIADVEAKLQSLSSALYSLENSCNYELLPSHASGIYKSLQRINLDGIQQKIEGELKKLNSLRERFSRRTLNIGVVGLMGQGKSTLLKSLSGLTDNEIPALVGGACTAVRSKIENVQGEITAEVTLHSENSFLQQVIHPYYDKLGFFNKPKSLNEFAESLLPSIQSTSAGDEQTYKHLRDDYYFSLNQYKHLLKPESLQTFPIRKEEISDYVMQKRDEKNRLINFKHLIVQEVKIFCNFENPDAGSIILVDVPGLGDSKLGDEELMLKTLEQEVDVVLFIKRPDPLKFGFHPVDTSLYDAAAKALNNLPKRSFMILNHCLITNNKQACEALQRRLEMKVVRCEIADCSNTEEANKVFDLVLNYLANNIEALDRESALSCQLSIIELQSEINIELEKASKALSKVMLDSDGSASFIVKFKQLWNELTNGLEELLKELRNKREQVDTDFKQQVEAALQACRKDTGIPSLKEIEELNNKKKGYGIAYETYLNEIRAHLSQHFLSLDGGLKRSLERVKSQVAEVLIEKGRLGNLTEARGAEFIQAIATQLPDELIPGQPSKLKFGFQMLAEFELSYRGLIQHRIRQHLDGLTPNEPGTLQLPKSPSAEKVLQNLKTAHAEAVFKCEEPLEDLLCEPSQAAFAIVEEFFDRILRAADVDTEWQIFLQRVRSQVWTEFKQLGAQTQILQELRNLVEQAAAANQLSLMQFLP